MRDDKKTKDELLKEMESLRKRIAKLRQTGKVLRKSEEKYHSLVNNIPDVLWTTDSNGNTTFISPNIKKVYGYKPEDIYTQGDRLWFGRIHPDDVEKVKEVYKALFEKGILFDIDYRIKRKDGEWIWLRDRSTVTYEKDGVMYADGIFSDITKHKKAEKMLWESERKYRCLAESLDELVYRADPNTFVATYVNNAIERFYGYSVEQWLREPNMWEDLIYPDDRERVLAEFTIAHKELKSAVLEYRTINKNKEVRWVEDHMSWEKDQQGKVVSMNGFVYDITERKQAEDVLKESETRFRALFQGAAEGMIVADNETKEFKYVNPAICKMLGYTEEELIRLSVQDIHRREDLEYAISEFKSMARGEKILSSYMPCLRKDGAIIYADIHTTKILIDGTQCNVGFFTDVSERKQAEEALRESEERHRSLTDDVIDSSKVGIFILDKSFEIVWLNQSMERYFGLQREEVIGKDKRRLIRKRIKDIFEDPETFVEKLFATYDNNTYIENFECHVLADGQREDRWLEHWSQPICSGLFAGGRIEHYTDITEIKRAEMELNEYRKKIAHAEKLASLETLTADMAHGLNSPISAVRLSIENSLLKLETTSCPDGIKEELEVALTGILHTDSIVRDFSDFAKKPSKEIVSKINLNVVAERIVNLFSLLVRQGGVSLNLKDMDKLPIIYLKEKDIEQLFLALIENAIQAAEGKKNRRIVISGHVKDGYVELQFVDNCGGIAKENLDKIFKPFFTTRLLDKGTGMGLSIVERIVTEAGGKVRVESKAGKGSTIFVTLPIHNGRNF